MKKLHGWFILIICFFFSNYLFAATLQKAKFITIADIHFDPFYDCINSPKRPCAIIKKLNQADYKDWNTIFQQFSDKKISRILHDTNYALLKLTLSNLQKAHQSEHPQFVIILGDFLGHDFRRDYAAYSGDKTKLGYEKFVKKILQFLTDEFNEVFPDIDIYPVVGNNDSYSGNYRSDPGGQFFQETAQTWAPLIKNKVNQLAFIQQFPVGGYYVVNLSDNHQLIVLNAVLFSARNKNNNKHLYPALSELTWLEKKLEMLSSQHKKIILAYHIPIGIDVYATLKDKLNKIHPFWNPLLTQKFEAELNKYPTTVTAMLVGHIHIESLQLVAYDKIDNIPVILTPSISPIYGNGPAFKIMTYDLNTLEVNPIRTIPVENF